MKSRLDTLLVAQGLAESRTRAQALILAGAVTVNGRVVLKSAEAVDDAAGVLVQQAGEAYVSRGGVKLEAALGVFDVTVDRKVAADIGASTGGFTDVLLRHNAARVYAIDVGYGQFAWRLRQDPRVILMERTNFRFVASLPEPISLAAVDVSFISLRLILFALARIVEDGADAILMVKPQFEAGKDRVRKGGVVRDPAVHRDVLTDVLGSCTSNGWNVCGLIASPITGPAGNREFLAHIRRGDSGTIEVDALIADVIQGGA